MNALDHFEYKTIEIIEHINGKGQLTHRPAWCYGELFVVKSRLDGKEAWKIGCTPIGAVFPNTALGLFHSLEDACEATMEVSKARNSWATLRSFGPEELQILQEISRKYRAQCNIKYEGQAITNPTYLNGATAENYQ